VGDKDQEDRLTKQEWNETMMWNETNTLGDIGIISIQGFFFVFPCVVLGVLGVFWVFSWVFGGFQWY
jgi:hypothetical protein